MGKNRHHRKPKSIGGSSKRINGINNIIIIDETHHYCWHVLFSNDTPQDIAKIINSIFLDPEYKFICVKRKQR